MSTTQQQTHNKILIMTICLVFIVSKYVRIKFNSHKNCGHLSYLLVVERYLFYFVDPKENIVIVFSCMLSHEH